MGLDVGYSVLEVGYSVLDVGDSVLDIRYCEVVGKTNFDKGFEFR